MNNTNTGGPAFPLPDIQAASPRNVEEMKAMAHGMTLRDYFAAKAMQGLIAGSNPEHSINLHGAAEWSYKMADAMLAARSAT